LAGNATPEGIATNGTDVWIVDSRSDKVLRYAGAAGLLSGSANTPTSFGLNNGNKNPKDIVTDGAHLWVVNDSRSDKVFKYTLGGTLVGSWTISTSGASSPTGITLDPSDPNHLWIVDAGTDRVYQYDGATMRMSGSQSASISFALAAGNTNPQGIADPPTGPSASSSAVPTPKKLDIRAAAALARSIATPIAAPRSSKVSGSGQASAVETVSGNAVVFSPIAAAPRSAVAFAPTPGKTQASVSFPAIDLLMADFGNHVIGKNSKGLALLAWC
jgi:hypothetical protein